MKNKQRKVLLSICSALAALTVAGATEAITHTAQAAETTPTFEMIYGAGIRVSDPTGMRFKTKLDEEYYNELTADGATAKLHVALIPYAMYTAYQADTNKGATALYPWLVNKYTASGIVDVTIPTDKIYPVTENGETYYCANAVISNIYFNNYHLEFVGVAYIQRGTADNYTYQDVTNITEAENARSVFEIACKASEDEEAYAKYADFLDLTVEKSMYRAYGVTCQETIDVEGNKTTESYTYNGTKYDTYDAMKAGVGVDMFQSTVTISEETVIVVGGTQEQLTATFNFSDGTTFNKNAQYTWKSLDESIATVDENGVVTAVGSGSATITVSAVGGRFIDTCTVNVTKGGTVNLDYEFLAKGDAGVAASNTGNATIDLTEADIVGTNVTKVTCNGAEVAIASKTQNSITLTNAPAGMQTYTFETTAADYVMNGCVYGYGISTKDEFIDWHTTYANVAGYKAYTVLLNDIDLEGEILATATSYFYATFDGMGHTISDFTYTNGFIWLMYPAVFKNVQFTEAVQDCTFAGAAVVQYGFFGNNLRGTVENVKICVTTKNISSAEHRGVLTFGLNTYDTATAPSLMQNVVVEVTPQADVAHYALQGQSKTEGLATINNVYMYLTASVTGGFGRWNDTVHTNSGFYASQAAMLSAVDFSTWAEPWQVDFNGVPYIGEALERKYIEIDGEFLAKGDAGVAVTNTGNATFDLSATGYDFSGAAKVLCNGEAVTLAGKTATSVTVTDAPAGKQVYTIVTPEADYVMNGFVYGQGISTKDEFLAWQTAAAAGTGKCYTVLLDDIDLEGATLTAPTTYYYGTFDGMGHTVSDFTYTNGFIWLMYPAVFKNVQFTEAVQDCTFAGAAVVQYGFFGNNLRGTVENVKICVTTKNISSAEHRGVLTFGLNTYDTATAPSLMQNVVVEVTPQADVAHYALQGQSKTEGLATINNVYMYLTASVTGGFGRWNDTVHTNSGFYASQAAMLSAVDFSTWAEPWQVDKNGVPYIGEAQESAPSDEKVTVRVEGVLDAPAGGVIGSDKTGIATVDFSATGYTLGVVSSVQCGTMDITYSVNGNTLIFTDAPAGEKVYTIVSGNTTYIVTINVHIVEKEEVTITEVLYGSDNETTTLAIESATVDFSGSEVTLGNVQSVTYGNGTAATYTVNGNILTLTNMTAGEETYTIVTDTHIYTVNICLYGYGISTKDEFLTWQSTEAIKYSNKGYTVLLNDIDLEGATLTAPTSYYYGTFDGRGHMVSNFTYTQGVIWLLNPAVMKNVQFTGATQDCSFAGTGAVRVGFFGSYIRGTVENVRIETSTTNMASGADHYGVLATNVANGNASYSTYLTNVVIAITPPSDSYHYVAMNANAYGTWDNVHAYYTATNTKGGALYATNNATVTNSAFYDSVATMLSQADFSTWGEPWVLDSNGIPYVGKAPKGSETVVVEGEFLAQGDGGIAQNAPTGNATIDFTDTVVKLDGVKSVTYGEENTAVTYSVSGNALTLTNAPAGDQTYTIATSGDTYIINACIYGHSISTAEEFEAYRAHGANWAYTVLLNDIDFDGASLAATSAYLRGTFDGRGHTIANVTLQASLFGNVYAGTGVIKNLQLINATQDCTNIVTASVSAVRNGFLAQTVNGTIENVLIKGKLINLPEGIAHWGLICYNGTPVIKNVLLDVKSNGTKKQMAANIDAGTLDNVYMILNNETLVSQSAVTDYEGATNSGIYATESKLMAAVDFSSWSDPWIVDGGELPYMSNYSEYLGFIHDEYVGTTSYKLVENGVTNYKILMDGDTYTEIWAVYTDLRNWFAKAGVTISWANDTYASNYNDSAKFISLGRTAALEQSGIEVDYDLLGLQGYQIITLGDDIYIIGENEGLSNAVYDLLNRLVGLEVYTTTSYVIDTVTDLDLPDLAITEVPDIEYRIAINGELAQYETNVNTTRRALRIHNMGDVIVSGGNAHNMTSTIVPYDEWGSTKRNWFYNSGEQLCYTAHGNSTDYNAMVAEAVANIKELLLAEPTKNLFSLTQMDMKNWCDCSACSALKTKYGTDAASQILFVNDVTDILNEWLASEQGGREVQFAIFAYYTTKDAPATQNSDGTWTAIDSSVVLNDNVSVWIAPIEDDFRININETNNDNNMRTMVESWSACTNSYFIWSYDTYFNNYMIPYDTYDAMQDMIRFCAEYNTKFFYAQGAHDLKQSTAFGDLKSYLYSKLTWNCNLDVNTLIDNFFNDVYKEAADSMKSVFEAWRTKSATFGGNIYSSADSWWDMIRTFDNTWLKKQLGLLETAINKIAAYKTSDPDLYTAIYDSIVAESISLRYLYKQRNSSEYSSSAWGTLAEDAARLGVNKVSEGVDF